MTVNLLDNLQALLDYHKVPPQIERRAEFISENCECDNDEIFSFLKGTGNLSKGVIRKMANYFEVDVFWLLQDNH